MDQHTQIELLARIEALEHLTKHLLWNVAVLVANERGMDDREVIEDLRGFTLNVRDELRSKTFPQLDAAMSDHLAQSVSQHVEALLNDVLREMEKEQGD